MPDPTTINDLLGRILRDTFRSDLNDLDVFLLFSIFHLYQIELAGAFLTDRPHLKGGDLIHADTQRGCSSAMASIWANSDDERSDYAYWYWRWNADWGSYARLENLSDGEKERLRWLMGRLETHPFVRRLVPEDFDLLGDDR